MKNILLIIFLFSVTFCFAQQQSLNIIPEPVKAEVKQGTFTITPSTKIIIEASGINNSINFFNDYLKKFYDFELKTSKEKSATNVIELNFDRLDNSTPGAYNMTVDKDKIYIGGDNEQGVFYGIQTLIQLLPAEKSNSLNIQQCNIIDSPRFAYRGLHLDCGRHFFSVDFIKQYIDFIAIHKMNTFHWHLTEDQGWRIEIKKYPKLTQVGACRNGTIIGHHPGTGNDDTKYCGYFTQAQIKDIVKYATDRYITIIPEIEMPGHASAAIAAYPQLSCFPDSSTKIAKGVKWSGDSTGKQVQQSWGVYPDVFAPT
ncbi:MAG TPA: beta-N-acetylhexosaminidase, partial [Parafilimonas sp.]|nr:beta-N-acetylhexosaminidase [Parafilimonas sp.]